MEMDPFFAVTDDAHLPSTPSAVTPGRTLSSPALNNSQHNNIISSQDNASGAASNVGMKNSKSESNMSATTSNTTVTSAPSEDPQQAIISQANSEISNLLMSKKISQSEVSQLQQILHENMTLKEKINKLKSLLARSAKVQSDFKSELSISKTKLEQAHQAIERLNERIEQLSSRPTHMDILADFESNWDRALLSMNTSENEGSGVNSYLYDSSEQQYQTGGEDPSSTDNTNQNAKSSQDNEQQKLLLQQDLNAAQAKIQQLESLNSSLLDRSAKLEQQKEDMEKEVSSLNSKNTNLHLELRMSKLENDKTSRKLRDKTTALQEMQMEIDLVTRASMDANARASESMQVAKSVQSDQRHVGELEAKVEALQEWALASAEAKRLSTERTIELEEKLLYYMEKSLELGVEGKQQDPKDPNTSSSASAASSENKIVSTNVSTATEGRKLWSRSASQVVGAGAIGTYVVELGTNISLNQNESVILKWKFDVVPSDLDIDFTIVKGIINDGNKKKKYRDDADEFLIPQRLVKGGAGGEVSGAFAVQNACTLFWSNKRSWVRPRALKYNVEAFAIVLKEIDY